MKTKLNGKDVDLTVKRDGTVTADGREIGVVTRDVSAPAAGFAAYAGGKRLPGDVKIGDSLTVWERKADAVNAVLRAVEAEAEARRRELDAEANRHALLVAAVLAVVAEADAAAPLPLTEWSRRRFERELENPREVSFGVSVELETESDGKVRAWERVDVALDLGRWGDKADRGKLNWSSTGRTLEQARSALSLYQIALVLAERMEEAARNARAALAEDRCPVHGERLDGDLKSTCRRCRADRLASEVCSG
jgi:hypothetical protein